MKPLSRKFYERDTKEVAKDLLGKVLVHRTPKGVLKGKIVEVEAYYGENDPGSHAYKGKTPRNEIMYGLPGFAYVYFCYGNHWLLNVVTEKGGKAGAVLFRALEPLEGIEIMKENRKSKEIQNLTNGPGKLTQALEINKKHNGLDLTKSNLFITRGKKENFEIVTTTRIGIKRGKELPLRFYIKGNKFVSVK